MKNRIEAKFQELKAKNKTAFIAFITAGDPNLKVTEELVLAFEHSGVDIVEVGVPFSDPLADGPTIQASSERALKNKASLKKIFTTVTRIRKRSQIPIALMTYYNPVFRYGEQKFAIDAKSAGVDGFIVPDLPPDEAGSFIKAAHRHGLSTIFFLSPTTRKERMKAILRASSGFIYYVSLTGVTGARKQLPSLITHNVKIAKELTDKPICVGFGISTRQQVTSIGRISDGVIVGSAIVKEIFRNKGKKELVKNVSRFVRQLTSR